MGVQRPLVTKGKGPGRQLLRCQVDLNTSTSKASVGFWSVTGEGKKITKRGVADTAFPDKGTERAKTKKNSPAILARMAQLRRELHENERVQKLNRTAGYRLVASLASYADKYKGVEEVILDSANREAVTKVHFNKKPKSGNFHVDPNLIDNFGQPAPFTMNANDESDLEMEVEKTYHSHVKMSGSNEDGIYSRDMVVFEGEETVATYESIKDQGVPRRLTDYIVQLRDDKKQGPPTGGTKGAIPSVTAATGASPQATATVETSQAKVSINVTAGQPDYAASWTVTLNIISEENGIELAE